MFFPRDSFQRIPPSFLADLHALWISIAQITYQNSLVNWMQMWDSSGAGVYAFSATSALLSVHQDSAGFPANGQSLKRTSLNARVIPTLGAQVREICAWNQHEDSDS
jgi:hypothetical protein